MKYTYLAAFICALGTLVSSLPVMPIARDAEIDYPSLSRRMPPAVPHTMSLKKSDVGTAAEHWALHVHPTQPGAGDLHVVHAVSDNTKAGVLQYQHLNYGTYNGPSTNPTSETHHIGTFATKTAAMNAISSVRNNVGLTHQFPTHNCVDFTCGAVNHLVNTNQLPETARTNMNAQYNANQAAVRHTTNTQANRQAAGL
jgi:hypothetical protein